MKENYIATLVHHKLETPIELSVNEPKLLIIESPSEFFSMVNELYSQFCGKDGNFILLSNGDRISLEKNGDMVTDIFTMDLSDKKVNSLLYKALEKEAVCAELSVSKNKLNSHFEEYLSDLFERLPLSLTFEEVQTSDILKMGKVRIQESHESFLEKLICYINCRVYLNNSKFFVFVNLKSVLSDSEIRQLYKHCELGKVGLLLIESYIIRPVLKEEQAVIITADLCEIVDK